MAAVGPLVGGWLTTDVSWRWAFWVNIPIGLLVLAGIVLYVPETRDESMRPGLDAVGVVLSALGLGRIVFALIEGQGYGWWRQAVRARSPRFRSPCPCGLALMAAFVRHPT